MTALTWVLVGVGTLVGFVLVGLWLVHRGSREHRRANVLSRKGRGW